MEYVLHLLVMTGIYAVLALSLNLLVGYTGIPSFGHAAFFGIGAYASALLALNGFSPWLSLAAAAFLAASKALSLGSRRFG